MVPDIPPFVPPGGPGPKIINLFGGNVRNSWEPPATTSNEKRLVSNTEFAPGPFVSVSNTPQFSFGALTKLKEPCMLQHQHDLFYEVRSTPPACIRPFGDKHV